MKSLKQKKDIPLLTIDSPSKRSKQKQVNPIDEKLKQKQKEG